MRACILRRLGRVSLHHGKAGAAPVRLSEQHGPGLEVDGAKGLHVVVQVTLQNTEVLFALFL
jgi:hypothetical protein